MKKGTFQVSLLYRSSFLLTLHQHVHTVKKILTDQFCSLASFNFYSYVIRVKITIFIDDHFSRNLCECVVLALAHNVEVCKAQRNCGKFAQNFTRGNS